MQKTTTKGLRLPVDGCMLVLLLCLMAYQVTGEKLHEWTGICMTLVVIVHQILNHRWYAAIFKGPYHAYRGLTTLVDLLLLVAMVAAAICGMAMSGYAVPFLYWPGGVYLVRPAHLAMSHWAFLLIGLHLGLHLPLMAAKWKLSVGGKTALSLLGTVLGGIGFWLLLQNRLPDYLFFRVPFAFLDYEKAGWLVFLENALILSACAFIGTQLALLCLKPTKGERKQPALLLACIAAAPLIGFVLNSAMTREESSASSGWTEAPQAQSFQEPAPALEEPQGEASPSTIPAAAAFRRT